MQWLVYTSVVTQVVVAVLLLGIARHDAKHFKIRNKDVLVLLALYLPAQGLLFFPALTSDLFAGVLLFALGFTMWLLRSLGAGDAKLMFPLGLHIGYAELATFAAILFVFSVFLYAAIRLAAFSNLQSGLGGKLAQLKHEGRVPYAIPLCVAAVPAILSRAIWTAGA
ncbi:prepilin peptidase [Alisedimentitalea sp. MJ-SS2]|uniref:prepilin peptidase n=1 Tax=Aliisedimentitalea sp. MJ-SS2 TaxID=3049795 RepID=UPI00290FB53A|nr:prepilin peptidase [Alisedimentitalea sp. MJ-SS2]MDU8928281.1 prepilin peptidase [Alisedimentitalea sp. MJ-SS2]